MLIQIALLVALAGVDPAVTQQTELFSDDFERGIAGWDTLGDGVAIVDSGDPDHGSVLALEPHGDVLATIRGSEAWNGVQLEFDVLFPTVAHSYLGVAYNIRQTGSRLDFGLVYIKGNDSYLRVNPHRDFNVGRTLYEEYRTPLAGGAAIRIGEWQRVRVEVIGNECHFYVGDFTSPQLTFSALELDRGQVGLQPRSVGGVVWVDNVRARPLRQFSYRGRPVPDVTYTPASLITAWEVAGPFDRTRDELARAPRRFGGMWRPFEVDARGAVITARVTDYHGPSTVAYFRTRIDSDTAGPAILHLSTVDDLALWVNGRFHWFIPRGSLAWYDHSRNEAHGGIRIPITLNAGGNEVVLRVRGGVYASGGFFAQLLPGAQRDSQ
jgi:hypothetical protein